MKSRSEYWAKSYNGPEYGLTIKHNGGRQPKITVDRRTIGFDFVICSWKR